MVEKLIILKACRDFSALGIKCVSMDAIASSLHVSKRTVYQRFKDKENLLACCLNYMARQFGKTMNEQIKKFPDAVSAVVQVNSAVLRYTLAFSPAFYRDLGHYPELYDRIRDQYKDKIESLYLSYLEEGRREELFLPDFDIPQTLIFFREQLRWLCRNPDVQPLKTYAVGFLTYLAGICTEKGRRTLRQFSADEFIINHLNQK